MIYVLGGMRQDCKRFYYPTQNDVQFKIYELINFEIFHLIFVDCGRPQVTETMENRTRDGGGGWGAEYVGKDRSVCQGHAQPVRAGQMLLQGSCS